MHAIRVSWISPQVTESITGIYGTIQAQPVCPGTRPRYIMKPKNRDIITHSAALRSFGHHFEPFQHSRSRSRCRRARARRSYVPRSMCLPISLIRLMHGLSGGRSSWRDRRTLPHADGDSAPHRLASMNVCQNRSCARSARPPRLKPWMDSEARAFGRWRQTQRQTQSRQCRQLNFPCP